MTPEPLEQLAAEVRLAVEMRDQYTFATECAVGGDDTESTDRDPHTVWLKVGNQSFNLQGYTDTKEEADWLRLMLGKALAGIVQHQQAELDKWKECAGELRRACEAVDNHLHTTFPPYTSDTNPYEIVRRALAKYDALK